MAKRRELGLRRISKTSSAASLESFNPCSTENDRGRFITDGTNLGEFQPEVLRSHFDDAASAAVSKRADPGRGFGAAPSAAGCAGHQLPPGAPSFPPRNRHGPAEQAEDCRRPIFCPIRSLPCTRVSIV